MVILWGWVFLMSEVPLAERRRLDMCSFELGFVIGSQWRGVYAFDAGKWGSRLHRIQELGYSV